MANLLNQNPIIVDTVGLIWDKPVTIYRIDLFPNAAGDGAVFYHYTPSTPLASKSQVTTTVSGTNTVTSSGAFVSGTDVSQYGVIKFSPNCMTSAGVASANIGLSRMVLTVSSADAIIVTPSTLTNEAAGVYDWDSYAPIPTVKLKSNGSVVETDHWIAPAGGLHLPNLILATLTANAVVHIYI